MRNELIKFTEFSMLNNRIIFKHKKLVSSAEIACPDVAPDPFESNFFLLTNI